MDVYLFKRRINRNVNGRMYYFYHTVWIHFDVFYFIQHVLIRVRYNYVYVGQPFHNQQILVYMVSNSFHVQLN